jgi:solute carrier family 25 (mitochondrial oxoglutarate transporter), member 11
LVERGSKDALERTQSEHNTATSDIIKRRATNIQYSDRGDTLENTLYCSIMSVSSSVDAEDSSSSSSRPSPDSNMKNLTMMQSSQQPPAATLDTAAVAVPLPTRMVLSALAGCGAATLCHPLDVIRVQMQTFHFNNTYHAATSIYQRAGLQNGLYAGISAAYLRQWLYGSCRMGIYSYLLERANMENAKTGKTSKIPLSQMLGMGFVAGGIGSFVGTPSELALVRMSADSKVPLEQRRNYTSVVNCLVRISREEGFTKLWRGATPTVARATLLSSCQMGITSEVKMKLVQSGWFGPDGQWLHGYPMMTIATLVSSFCANVVANPFDVVKSRLQNMAVQTGTAGSSSSMTSAPPMYSGMLDCFVKSIRAEGIMVLYAGFTPAFVKLAPYSIISLTLADKLTRAVTGKDAL